MKYLERRICHGKKKSLSQDRFMLTSWNVNKEFAVDILLHLQIVPLYTLLVKMSSVESDEIFAK